LRKQIDADDGHKQSVRRDGNGEGKL
jgi:hypothetical protein